MLFEEQVNPLQTSDDMAQLNIEQQTKTEMDPSKTSAWNINAQKSAGTLFIEGFDLFFVGFYWISKPLVTLDPGWFLGWEDYQVSSAFLEDFAPSSY